MTEAKNEFFELGMLIRDMIRVLNNRVDERIDEKIKITYVQFHFLDHINRNDDEVIQQDMAECLKKDKSVIFRMIDTLEEKGLIRRVVSKKDRRKNCLMVTKTGTRLLDNYRQIALELIEQIHQGISEEDKKVFYQVVQQFKANTNRL